MLSVAIALRRVQCCIICAEQLAFYAVGREFFHIALHRAEGGTAVFGNTAKWLSVCRPHENQSAVFLIGKAVFAVRILPEDARRADSGGMLILIDHLRAEHIANNIENMDSFGIVDDGEVGARGGGLNQRRDTADGIGGQEHFSCAEDVSAGAVIQDDMRITQPSGEEGCLLQRQEAVNLIGLFPLPIAKDAVNKGIHAGCFCWQVVNNMEGLLAWQKEKPCTVGGGGAISQGAVLPAGKIGRGCQIKLPFAAGIEQIGDSFILADGKNRRGFLRDFLRHCPAVMGKAATENIAVFIIKKIEIAILRFQIFYIRILHGNAPYRFFITVYAGKGKCIIKKTGKELLFCGNYGMFEIGKAERGIFMSMLDTFRMSGTLYVCAIILVMLLIYAAICYLEWRLAQKEEWWKGMILPIVFLLLGRGGRFLGIILLVIYGLQRNKLQKEQNKIEDKIEE